MPSVEASLARSRMRCKFYLQPSTEMLARLPCNPSIGGSAKGIVVREGSALGGGWPEVSTNPIMLR